MSFNGSEKEFLMTLFLGKEEIINKVLDIQMKEVQFEKHFPGLKIDMYSPACNLGTEVFVESLLLKSNKAHQDKILKIIQLIDTGIIVYIALDFHKKHIEELHNAVKQSGKRITIYFIQLNGDILKPLDKLNQMHKLKVYENLSKLNIENPIRLLSHESIIMLPTVSGEIEYKENVVLNNLESKRKKENEFLLKTLRKRIEYFLPFHREKANLQKLRIISFGSGRSDCSYYVSLSDSRNIAFVELRFSAKNSRIYDALKAKEVSIQEKFDEVVRFKGNCISIEIKPLENIVDTAEKLSIIFEKMITAFSNYTYYFYEDKKEMWQYHEQGI